MTAEMRWGIGGHRPPLQDHANKVGRVRVLCLMRAPRPPRNAKFVVKMTLKNTYILC